MRDDRPRLEDILDAIACIERYAAKGQTAFAGDELIRNWMGSHLQIIGEAASALSQDLRAKHPEVPWKDIMGLRHVLVHHYFAVNLKIVWSVIEEDIPVLKPQIEAILAELSSNQPPEKPSEHT